MAFLTCDDHHAYSEDLFIICLRSHVSEADRRHAGHGEVKRGHVHGLLAGSVN